MKLHWSPRSPFVRKVMVTAHELGLADRIQTIRSLAAMGTPNPAIMADNPLSKIPTLVLDDGQVLADSLTIMLYLDSLAGNRLLPSEGAPRWEVLTRQSLANGLLDLLVLWRNERDKPPPQQTPSWLEAFPAKAAATLDRFEQQAAAIADKPLDLGHIALFCALAYLDFRFPDLQWRTGRPTLAAWAVQFAARPSAQATGILNA